MGKLWDRIRRAVEAERYVIGRHANEQLRLRQIAAWQIMSQMSEALLLKERAECRPNPVVEVRQFLSDGTAVKAVWAWLPVSKTAKLVTVHFFDR